jgi:hypothetical protein
MMLRQATDLSATGTTEAAMARGEGHGGRAQARATKGDVE